MRLVVVATVLLAAGCRAADDPALFAAPVGSIRVDGQWVAPDGTVFQSFPAESTAPPLSDAGVNEPLPDDLSAVSEAASVSQAVVSVLFQVLLVVLQALATIKK